MSKDVKMTEPIPWQIAMFRRSLKKQLKLDALIKIAGDFKDHKCLLITCGDNNGALNYFFREQGGDWRWADVSEENLGQMQEFLGEEVKHAEPDRLPFEKETFDKIISIDVLEHLEEDLHFLTEIYRILKPTGIFLVTVPNGDPRLLANRIKGLIGMSPEKYGHTRAGYTLHELGQATSRAGFKSIDQSGYSRFFTEMVELAINYSYVFMLSKKANNRTEGHIAPTSANELKTHGTAYRLYSLAFPLMRAISKLDGLLPSSTNNAVIIKARKTGLEEAVK
jgi:SAM-dependent methyltransferase